jgi:hypothetical protein
MCDPYSYRNTCSSLGELEQRGKTRPKPIGLVFPHIISRHYAMFVVIRLFKKQLKFLIIANL